MWECDKCGGYRLDRVKVCHCKSFEIINEDGEECKPVQAMTAEDAALEYAEQSNVGHDYYLMDGSVVIEVGGKKFEISAEPDIHYSASELKDT